MEILRWHEEGYFGRDLLLRCVRDSENVPLRPLGDWMLIWDGGLQSAPPPGYSVAAAAAAAQSSDRANSAHAPSDSLSPVVQYRDQVEHGEADMAFSEHALHSQRHEQRHVLDRVSYEQQPASMAAVGEIGHLHERQEPDHSHEGSATGRGVPTQLQRNVNGHGAVDLDPSLNTFAEQLQRQQLYPGQPGAIHATGFPQQPVGTQPQYGFQRNQQVQHPQSSQVLGPGQQLPMHGQTSAGPAMQPSAAQPAEPTAPASLRARRPASVQLQAGGSSQDAEQDADVTELLELLRQPVSPFGGHAASSASGLQSLQVT